MKKRIKKLIEKKLRGEYEIVSELTDHGNLYVYLIKSKEDSSNYILRIGKIGAGDLSLKNNLFALKVLKNEKNVPRLINFGKSDRYFYSIETFLPGNKRKENINRLRKLINEFKEIHNHKSRKCGWLGTSQKDWKRFFYKIWL